MGIEDDIAILERGIRELQVEWEKFFGGVEKKPPLELRARVEGLIKRYAYTDIRNNSERFKYQSLTARYNTFNELWNKRLRALEEGRPLAGHAGRPSPPPPSPVPEAPRAAQASAFRVERAEDGTVVRALFDQYLEARKQAGDKGGMNFENFQKVVKEQTRRILTEKDCRAVDFRLEVKEGKVTLKAKPIQ